ncbi:MAG TPA: DUF3108 domain-containing protein [Burkholderiales bacterium]|nr:DUF3108 domain-containing protein [Burkholderiales bacterium]
MTPRALWLALAMFTAGAHAELPARMQITYEVQRNGRAMAEISAALEYANGRYSLTEQWHGRGMYALLGKAARTSSGTVAGSLLRPIEFSDERSGRDTARAWFDWGAKTLTMRYKGKTKREPIPPNAQDRISFVLALALAPTGTKAMDFHLVDGKGVSHHVYDFGARERVATPAGEFEALKVERVTEDRRLEIWLATALGNMPVRVLVADSDGSRYDQVATRVSAR